MKNINAKIFSFKYKLFKKLETSLTNDKNAIKNGAKITFQDYCKIQLVNCEKSTLDKDKVQNLCDKYGIDIKSLEKTTNYTRIDIDNVPTEVDNKIDNVLTLIDNDNNDAIIRKALANIQ